MTPILSVLIGLLGAAIGLLPAAIGLLSGAAALFVALRERSLARRKPASPAWMVDRLSGLSHFTASF